MARPPPAVAARRLVGRFFDEAMLSELALIADTNRLTSASAAIDSEVLRLSRKMFHRILEEYPEIAVKLHERILEEFQQMIRRIEELAPRFAG